MEPGRATLGLRERRRHRLDPFCENVPEEKKENARCPGVEERPHAVRCAAQTAERQPQEYREAGDRAKRQDLAHRHRAFRPLPVRYSPRGGSSFGRPTAKVSLTISDCGGQQLPHRPPSRSISRPFTRSRTRTGMSSRRDSPSFSASPPRRCRRWSTGSSARG